MRRPPYEHTQPGWAIRLAFVLAALLFLAMSVLPPFESLAAARMVLWSGAALTVALAWTAARLTVRIDAGALHVRFGLGWPRTTITLADIVRVEVTRTNLADGWGMHRTRRGWLYNASGFDAVIVRRRDGKAVLIGTDEPRRLRAALEKALPAGGR